MGHGQWKHSKTKHKKHSRTQKLKNKKKKGHWLKINQSIKIKMPRTGFHILALCRVYGGALGGICSSRKSSKKKKNQKRTLHTEGQDGLWRGWSEGEGEVCRGRWARTPPDQAGSRPQARQEEGPSGAARQSAAGRCVSRSAPAQGGQGDCNHHHLQLSPRTTHGRGKNIAGLSNEIIPTSPAHAQSFLAGGWALLPPGCAGRGSSGVRQTEGTFRPRAPHLPQECFASLHKAPFFSSRLNLKLFSVLCASVWGGGAGAR